MPEKLKKILTRLWKSLFAILVVILLFTPLAVYRTNMFMGYSLSHNSSDSDGKLTDLKTIFPNTTSYEYTNDQYICYNSSNDTLGMVVYTQDYAPNVYGYGGKVSLTIVLNQDSVIERIILNDNAEDRPFLDMVYATGLFEAWNGLSVDDALNKQVNFVSGATMSSSAVIRSMELTLQELSTQEVTTPKSSKATFSLKWQSILALLVMINSVLVATIFIKSKGYRKIQLWLNLVVLGVLCGSFISMNAVVSSISSGILLGANYLAGLMIILAVVMPIMTGRKFYCFYLCPLGSMQEILGGVRKSKLKLPKKVVQYGRYLPTIIWGTCLILWSLNLGLNIGGYELFSSLLIATATTPFLILLAILGVCSIFINRPYCQYICPTGCMIRYTEN